MLKSMLKARVFGSSAIVFDQKYEPMWYVREALSLRTMARSEGNKKIIPNMPVKAWFTTTKNNTPAVACTVGPDMLLPLFNQMHPRSREKIMVWKKTAMFVAFSRDLDRLETGYKSKSGMCVCVCVCVREREREREDKIFLP